MNYKKGLKAIGCIFMAGVQEQLKKEWVWLLGIFIGVHQKDLVFGIAGGVVCIIGIVFAHGTTYVIEYWHSVERAFKKASNLKG